MDKRNVLLPISVADPETPRRGGELANKFFFPEIISIYRNKVRTIILIKV